MQARLDGQWLIGWASFRGSATTLSGRLAYAALSPLIPDVGGEQPRVLAALEIHWCLMGGLSGKAIVFVLLGGNQRL
jgi:hypothetical protein